MGHLFPLASLGALGAYGLQELVPRTVRGNSAPFGSGEVGEHAAQRRRCKLAHSLYPRAQAPSRRYHVIACREIRQNKFLGSVELLV